jgi:hypothetical protein
VTYGSAEQHPAYNLPAEVGYEYGRISARAGYAAEQLDAAWKRPIRHNVAIERAALYHVVRLDEVCERVEASREARLPAGVPQAQIYDMRAAMLVVMHTVPYEAHHRAILRNQATLRSYEFASGDDPISDEAESLVDEWHEWLWRDREGHPTRNVSDLGASAILAEGCGRLVSAAEAILTTTRRSPDSVN